MEEQILTQAVDRIREMEAIFDALLAAADRVPPAVPEDRLAVLLEYYEGGQWLRDYELDETGLLPGDLKRGVLSEDGVYNLLARIRDTILHS
jgi:hypothetical protein